MAERFLRSRRNTCVMADREGETPIQAATEILRATDRLIAFTGAGVSTESGIPDFRGPDGVWDTFDPADLSIQALRDDPETYWEQRSAFESAIDWDTVSPNPAHEALADLETAGQLECIITQNVDALHQAAGTESVLELHGTRRKAHCIACRETIPVERLEHKLAKQDLPPRCDSCGGLLKYATVAFGERLPEHTLRDARRQAAACDGILVVGSSLTVEPAASLPMTAVDTGANLVIVNHDSTSADSIADVVIRKSAGDAVPAIVHQLLDDVE